MQFHRISLSRLDVVWVGLVTASGLLSQSIPPARWDVQTKEGQDFPRTLIAAFQKYASEYNTPDAKDTVSRLLKVYNTGDGGVAMAIVGLSNDAILPLGDGLRAATAEYSSSKYWLNNRGTMADDRTYEAMKQRMLNSQTLINVTTMLLRSKCDKRTVPLLRGLHFSASSADRKMNSILGGKSVEESIQASLNEAIADIESGACRSGAERR